MSDTQKDTVDIDLVNRLFAIQRANLLEWKSVLNEDAYRKVYNHVQEQNAKFDMYNDDPYRGIFRGQDIDTWVHNLAYRTNKGEE